MQDSFTSSHPVKSKGGTHRQMLTLLFGILVFVGALTVFQRARELQWPGLHHDAPLYLSTAINLGHGGPSVFSVYARGYEINGDWEFDYHGQLYPRLLSLIGGRADVQGYLRLLGTINLATLLCASFAGYLLLKRVTDVPTAFFIAACFGVLNGCVAQYLQGRPEQLIPLVLLLLVFARFHYSVSGRYRNCIDAFEIGVVATISPIPGALLGLYRAAQPSTTDAYRLRTHSVRLLVLSAGAIVTWWIFTVAASEYSATRVFKNTVDFGFAHGGAPRVLSLIHRIWLFDWRLPLIGLVFAAGWVASGLGWLRVKGDNAMLAVGVCLWILSALAAFRFAAYQFTPYNLICLLPVVLDAMSGLTEQHPTREDARSRAFIQPVFFTLLAVVPTSLLVQETLLQSHVASSGTLRDAAALVKPIFDSLDDGERIAISDYDGLMALDHYPFKTLTVSAFDESRLCALEDRLDIRCCWLLVRQNGSPPPQCQIGAFRLFDHNYRTSQSSLPVVRWGSGASFRVAVYQRSPHQQESHAFSETTSFPPRPAGQYSH